MDYIEEEIEKYIITNIACAYCGGQLGIEGIDGYWFGGCNVCGIGVGGATKEEVADKLSVRPIVTQKAEFEECEY